MRKHWKLWPLNSGNQNPTKRNPNQILFLCGLSETSRCMRWVVWLSLWRVFVRVYFWRAAVIKILKSIFKHYQRSWQVVSYYHHLNILRTQCQCCSNFGLRVVGGFHKTLERQKTVPPKTHPFSGGENSDQLECWNQKFGCYPSIARMVRMFWENLSDPVRSSSTRHIYPGLLAKARHWPEKGLLREYPLSCTIHSLKAVVLHCCHVRLFDSFFTKFLAKWSDGGRRFRSVWGLFCFQCFGRW